MSTSVLSNNDNTAEIEDAARWLASHWEIAQHPLIGTLRAAYGLSFLDAVKALAVTIAVWNARKARIDRRGLHAVVDDVLAAEAVESGAQ